MPPIFWSPTPRPDYKVFTYIVHRYEWGHLTKTTNQRAWILDKRDVYRLLHQWNSQPESPITGLKWTYVLIGV